MHYEFFIEAAKQLWCFDLEKIKLKKNSTSHFNSEFTLTVGKGDWFVQYHPQYPVPHPGATVDHVSGVVFVYPSHSSAVSLVMPATHPQYFPTCWYAVESSVSVTHSSSEHIIGIIDFIPNSFQFPAVSLISFKVSDIFQILLVIFWIKKK